MAMARAPRKGSTTYGRVTLRDRRLAVNAQKRGAPRLGAPLSLGSLYDEGRRLERGLPVRGDDGGAAETDVVLQADLRAVDLTLVRQAADLPVELGALREAGRAERVTLGDQPARGVHDPRAAVGRGLVVDELARPCPLRHRPSAS